MQRDWDQQLGAAQPAASLPADLLGAKPGSAKKWLHLSQSVAVVGIAPPFRGRFPVS